MIEIYGNKSFGVENIVSEENEKLSTKNGSEEAKNQDQKNNNKEKQDDNNLKKIKQIKIKNPDGQEKEINFDDESEKKEVLNKKRERTKINEEENENCEHTKYDQGNLIKKSKPISLQIRQHIKIKEYRDKNDKNYSLKGIKNDISKNGLSKNFKILGIKELNSNEEKNNMKLKNDLVDSEIKLVEEIDKILSKNINDEGRIKEEEGLSDIFCGFEDNCMD